MKINKKIYFIMFMAFIVMASFIGCSSKSKAVDAFNQYKDKWQSLDYKGMYEMLSSDSKNTIDETTFVQRLGNIYGAMNASNIAITLGDATKENNDVVIPFTVSMDTVAGNLKLDNFKATIVKEDDGYKVNWNDNLIFPNMQEGDKLKVNTKNAVRGKILDKDGKVLAEDGEVSIIGIHPAIFNKKNKDAKIKEMAKALDISEDTITKKLDANINPSHFVEIVKALPNDPKINGLKNREDDGILIKKSTSRIYNGGEAFGRLVGYVGPITKEELEKNKNKGYNTHSLIGKSGLEQVYEDTLKCENGGEIYIERGDKKIEVASKNPKDGKDVKISIDSNLQKKIYSEMNGEKGASTAVNPKSGEVLAMVSSPSYDSNMFTTYMTKTEKKQLEETKNAAYENRFTKLYSPGSTFKLITATTGLEDGVIKPNDKKDIKGLNWQKDTSWGDYKVTRVDDPGKPVDLNDAVKYSDNIYFAQVALDLGADKFIEGAKKFGIGEKIEFGYPMETSQVANGGKIDGEIGLADSGYGQGQVLVTPLNMTLAYSALSNNGDIMKPRLVTSINNKEEVFKKGAIDKKYLPNVITAFETPINSPGGTATDAKIQGQELAGKTGTAEIKQAQNDAKGTENGWFIATDIKKSKITIAMILEDVKDKGGSHAVVPKVRNVVENYLK
ncbi:penicillin-binding transpeptidase domain-containing protein [Clostridium sp. Ade.TY]|uniref:penicillin-binding transpeptidase domain-containing protein n=1 Tax=Clostridium sp. Ade.TY TaxID=1391647 RepID=UPI0003FC06CF|nr:penicillin-binding transpeptidase domain-containing protein [Clostridium sp. Ade.TY]